MIDPKDIEFYRRTGVLEGGSFAVIGRGGTLRISRDLAAHWPANKHYCQVGYCAAGPALLLIPGENGPHMLRWQTSPKHPERSPRVSAGGVLKFFQLTPLRAHPYPARWVQGMIQIDLSGDALAPPAAGADGPIEKAVDGRRPDRVVCVKCGVAYKAVQREAGWCPFGHRERVTGKVCPGVAMAGRAVS